MGAHDFFGRIQWWQWLILIGIIVGVGMYFNSMTITGSKCQGYCAADNTLLLQAKATCETGVGSTDQPASMGVKCTIVDGCLSCKECKLNYCTLLGPCENGHRRYTCINECTGDFQEKTVECTSPPPADTGDNECSSDSDCNDNDLSTKDTCAEVGGFLGIGTHYECQNTNIPYYDDMVMCSARSYFFIENAYEWRENTVDKCAIPIVNLICHTESDPYCTLKPDISLSIILGCVMLFITIGGIFYKFVIKGG